MLLARDPFSHYVDPDVEDAAVALLEDAGLNVRVLDLGGAGAAMITKGFTAAARRHARRVLEQVLHADPDGELPLAFLEPPELEAVLHDYGDLLGAMSDAEKAALKRATSVERVLLATPKWSAVNAERRGQHVLFYPHCHEKAGAGTAEAPQGVPFAGMQLLGKCGFDVELVDAGCCGMAGTFGYEAEHYDISQKIGELKLFPAIRNDSDALIAATGGACRLHIAQGTGRRAEHPLVLAGRAQNLL